MQGEVWAAGRRAAARAGRPSGQAPRRESNPEPPATGRRPGLYHICKKDMGKPQEAAIGLKN